jgi:hypothetical protein
MELYGAFSSGGNKDDNCRTNDLTKPNATITSWATFLIETQVLVKDDLR